MVAGLFWGVIEPVETLLHVTDRNDVEKAVLVQIVNEYDNSYVQERVKRHADRFVAVVLVDS